MMYVHKKCQNETYHSHANCILTEYCDIVYVYTCIHIYTYIASIFWFKRQFIFSLCKECF